MHERPCIRGCVIRGRHLPNCPEVSGAAQLLAAIFRDLKEKPCTGCLPRLADDGSLLCTSCSTRLRGALEEAPDLCAHLRSLMDPAKAAVYDREKLGGSAPTESAPPMSPDLVDAADEVLGILTYFAEVFGDTMDYSGRHRFGAGTDSEAAYFLARTPAWYLLENFGGIVNDTRVVGFATAVLGPSADPDTWTIAKVMSRWPLVERAHFARVPCPNVECGLRTVRVTPPKMSGQRTSYECRNCHWSPPEGEQDVWAIYLEGAAA